MIEFITENLLSASVGATVATAGLGILGRFFPKPLCMIIGLTGEVGKLLLNLNKSCKNKKITVKELDSIVKDAKDVRDLFNKCDKK